MKELSVVVLCYHSGESILPIFDDFERTLNNMKVDYEIILVANDFANSKDRTKDIVLNIAKRNHRVMPVTNIKEGMMGWDMVQGLNASTGKYICVIDGDGQFPIESIKWVYDTMIESNVDIVKTYRVKREDGFYRSLVSVTYNVVFNLLFPGLNSKDINSKPKLISRDAYKKMTLQSTDWFIDAEIMITARKLNLNIKEIPIVFLANNHRQSFVRIGAIYEFIVNLVKARIRN